MFIMSVIPFFDPSTTPVWKEEKSSGHGIGVGEAPKPSLKPEVSQQQQF